MTTGIGSSSLASRVNREQDTAAKGTRERGSFNDSIALIVALTSKTVQKTSIICCAHEGWSG